MESIEKIAFDFQKNEITQHIVYRRLARFESGNNRKTLEKIAEDELKHFHFWKKYSKKEVKPDMFHVLEYSLLAKLTGLTFAIKLMEKGEKKAQLKYASFIEKIPAAKKIVAEEAAHEKKLTKLINEEKLEYIGAMVLGLNDALVELTGTIAGLTFALQNTTIVSIAALITGISAALSMASSEYLSKKSEGDKNPLKAAIYTGITYIFTVLFLVFPYFIFKDYYSALALTLTNAVLVVIIFSYFMSTINEQPFGKKFIEMASISLGVAAVSFLIGLALRQLLGVNV
ncbi:MAG: VIT1/CCC1 transporter family protein [Candidatus Diapherotrites archaeon]|nr:VIT1/CCC1 transporter family protein [Candidatus Diapherotrites archaeon]